MKKLFSIVLFAGLIFGALSCNNQSSDSTEANAQVEIAEGNLKAGEKYIADMKKSDPKFVQTKSGLCYKVLEEGEGENFKADDTVDVIYVGKHIDGSEFDSSNGEPVPFNLQNVVHGFREVIMLMKPGSKVIAIIPSHIGYREKGNGTIGPNETLVFEITTLGIHK